MTTEQLFFEAFGIEPKYQDRCALEDRCKEKGLPWSEVEKRCPYKMNCTNDCVDAYDFAVYPPITYEIVLKLIKILLDCDIDILMAKDENGYIARKNIMSYSMHWVVDENFNNMILKLCIQLKGGIQDQVRALFK